ncbi:MAG TPA: DUF4184 family protein [Bacteroidia bacterium]|nr:DUF4184 family protein [Bacteroidia bacterium]
MPFTFAHPAAILPAKFIRRKWVSFTALAIGSMTPDFEYFIRMRNLGVYGHTWAGLLWFDLPVAFILTFIYHGFVRDGLIDHLPAMFRKRLNRFKEFNWPAFVKQNLLTVIICLMLGIATHIVWDSFTHRTGYFVNKIPWLLKNTDVFGIGQVRFYILQVVSSSAGLIILFYGLFMLPKDETLKRKNILLFWTIAALITVSIVTIRVYTTMHRLPLEQFNNLLTIHFFTHFFNHRSADDFIMTTISAFLISLILTPLLVKKSHS